MSNSEKYVSNVVNNINPKKKYSEIDLMQTKIDLSKSLCTEDTLKFVESKTKPLVSDALTIAKKIEEAWRECLLKNTCSGVYSSKDTKNVGLYLKNELGEYIPITGVYNHENLGVILEM